MQKCIFDNPEKLKIVLSSGLDAALAKDIVDLSGRSTPRVVQLGIASRENAEVVEYCRQMFSPFAGTVKHLNLLEGNLTPEQMYEMIAESDIVWVSGGSTEYLMERLSFYYLEESLDLAAERGAVMCGSSAGGICWSYAGFNDFSDGRYDLIHGLRYAPLFFCPHYQAGRWPEFDKRLESETASLLPDEGWGVTDGTTVFYTGGKTEVRFYVDWAFAAHLKRDSSGKWERNVVKP